MKKGITVQKYIASKQLTFKEVEKTFKKVKELIDIDTGQEKGCLNCSDVCNQYKIPSEPWTGAIHCIACDSLLFTIFSDRMGGCSTDTVFVYEQKNRPMYKLYYKCDIQMDCIECRICGTVSSDKKDIKKLFCKKCNKKHL